MNRGPELEADLQSQASSPAQNNQLEMGEQSEDQEGEQRSKVIDGSKQTGGEQAAASNGVSKSGALAQRGEQKGEQRVESGESVDRRRIANRSEGNDRMMDEHSAQGSEQDKKDDEAGGEQPLQTSHWLKSILPGASNGWWDVRDKSNGMAIKFRWRDPDLQVITPLLLTSAQFETLKQSDYEDAKNMIREQISFRLRDLCLDPAKRGKALIVARKLGININPDEYKIAGAED